MTKPIFHVAIVGAGIGGLTTAIAIRRAGHRVTVLEQTLELGPVGAGIQIPPNSAHVLHELGVLPLVTKHACNPQETRIRTYKDGEVLLRNSTALLPKLFGYPFLTVHRADLHKVLVEVAQEAGVCIQLGSRAVGVNFDMPYVKLKDRPDFYADVIIGADGLMSQCREALIGRPDPPQRTGDLAYRIAIKVEDMRKHEELAEFLDNPATDLWMGPGSIIVSYLLKSDGYYNIAIICPDTLPESVYTVQGDVEAMRSMFSNWDPKLRILLSLVDKISQWRLLDSKEMERWSHPNGNFALMGDACHAMLPYLGQGASMALEDAAVLGSLFSKIVHRSQLPDLLTIFETMRKPRTTTVVKATVATGLAEKYPDGPLQRERDRQFREEKSFEGFPMRLGDPTFLKFLYGYDAFHEAEKAWATYLNGRFPGTIGMFRAGLEGNEPPSPDAKLAPSSHGSDPKAITSKPYANGQAMGLDSHAGSLRPDLQMSELKENLP